MLLSPFDLDAIVHMFSFSPQYFAFQHLIRKVCGNTYVVALLCTSKFKFLVQLFISCNVSNIVDLFEEVSDLPLKWIVAFHLMHKLPKVGQVENYPMLLGSFVNVQLSNIRRSLFFVVDLMFPICRWCWEA